MPTEIHDAHQRWAISSITPWYARGLISLQENELLGSGPGTSFTGFAGMYQGSHKEQDSFFRADSLPFPSIVNEAGSSESFPHLRNDKDLWMHGCAFVELVILLSWTKVSGNRIKGIIEVWRRNGAGGLSVTEMPILPRPVPPPASELIEFTRGQLFGPAAIAGQNPDTVLSLDVSRLRMIAEEVITLRMGLTPA